MYTPQNIYVFLAAYNGAISGFGVQGNNAVSPTPSRYIVAIAAAAAYAEEFDTAWGPTADSYQVQAVEDVSCAYWHGVGATLANANLFAPSGYMVAAAAIIALITEGATGLTSLGITPPAYPPGGGGGGVAGASGYVVWAPASPTQGNFVQTLTEVNAAANAGAFILYISGACVVEAGQALDPRFERALGFSVVQDIIGSGVDSLLIRDTGTVAISQWDNLSVDCECTTSPAFDYPSFAFITARQTNFALLGTATVPAFKPTAALAMVAQQCRIAGNGAGVPFMGCNPGAETELICMGTSLSVDAWGGDSGSVIGLNYDASSSVPAQTATLQDITYTRLDQSQRVFINANVLANAPVPGVNGPLVGDLFYSTDEGPGLLTFDDSLGVFTGPPVLVRLWADSGNTSIFPPSIGASVDVIAQFFVPRVTGRFRILVTGSFVNGSATSAVYSQFALRLGANPPFYTSAASGCGPNVGGVQGIAAVSLVVDTDSVGLGNLPVGDAQELVLDWLVTQGDPLSLPGIPPNSVQLEIQEVY